MEVFSESFVRQPQEEIWNHVNFLGAIPVPLKPQQVQTHQEVHNRFINLVSILTGSPVNTQTPKEEIRTKICMIEKLMEQSVAKGEMRDENDYYPLKHYHTDGVYARELTIPAGNLVVGKIHKHEHLNFISKGRVSVLTEDGNFEELVAPCTLISPAGVKRLLFTHEDTVWTVVHATDEKDLDKIEHAVIAQSYTELGVYDPVKGLLEGK